MIFQDIFFHVLFFIINYNQGQKINKGFMIFKIILFLF